MQSAAAVDIDALLDDQPLRARHGLIVGALLLMFFVSNFGIQIMAMTAPAMASEWGIGAQALAASMAMGWFGAAIGALTGGIVGDRIGRRWTVIVAVLIAGGATFATGLVNGTGGLLLLRALAGLGLGGAFPPGLALISECLPAKRRGMLVSAAMLCGPLGIISCATVAGIVIPQFGWRVQFFIGGAGVLLSALIMVPILVESPRFLASRPKRHGELRRTLALLGAHIDPGSRIVEPAGERRSSLGALLVPNLRSITIRLLLSFFAIYLVVSALLAWLPTILENVGYPVSAGGAAISAWSGAGIVGTITTGWCIGRFGSRKTARMLAISAGLGMALLVIVPLEPGTSRLGLIIPMLFAGFGMSGVMTALFAFVTTLYESEIRSTAVGVADMVGRGTSVIASYGAIFALDVLGMRLFFAVLALLALSPLLLLYGGKRPAGRRTHTQAAL